MLLEPVVRQFAQFARLDEESAAQWAPLCEASAAWIESMRKPAVPPEGEVPPAGEGKPPAGEEPPSTGEEEPDANGEAPPTEGQDPDVNGEAPPTEGQDPDVNGEAPPTEGQDPDVNGEAPPTEGQEPAADGEAPTEGEESPPAEGETPPGDGDAAPEADDPRLVLAAAGEAFYRYSLVSSGGDVQSLKIGDISVSESSGNGGSSGACALRDLLLAGAASLLEPGFAGLWQVEG